MPDGWSLMPDGRERCQMGLYVCRTAQVRRRDKSIGDVVPDDTSVVPDGTRVVPDVTEMVPDDVQVVPAGTTLQ